MRKTPGTITTTVLWSTEVSEKLSGKLKQVEHYTFIRKKAFRITDKVCYYDWPFWVSKHFGSHSSQSLSLILYAIFFQRKRIILDKDKKCVMNNWKWKYILVLEDSKNKIESEVVALCIHTLKAKWYCIKFFSVSSIKYVIYGQSYSPGF